MKSSGGNVSAGLLQRDDKLGTSISRLCRGLGLRGAHVPSDARVFRGVSRADVRMPLTSVLIIWIIASSFLEGFPSGQREQTVNLSAMPSKVRILPPPPELGCRICWAGVAMIAEPPYGGRCAGVAQW